MDILKHQFPIKSLIFLKSNCHAKMAPDTPGIGRHIAINCARPRSSEPHSDRACDRAGRRPRRSIEEPRERLESGPCRAKTGRRDSGWSHWRARLSCRRSRAFDRGRPHTSVKGSHYLGPERWEGGSAKVGETERSICPMVWTSSARPGRSLSINLRGGEVPVMIWSRNG